MYYIAYVCLRFRDATYYSCLAKFLFSYPDFVAS